MSIPRSKELWTVAYFLSRCGHRTHPERPSDPPSQLCVETWHEAYDVFFDALAAGRTAITFRHTLKNARDRFDAHLDSGRIGWREASREQSPLPLGEVPSEILTRWSQRSDDELWSAVRGFMVMSPTQEASDIADAPADRVATTTYRILRDTELARRVKAIHRFECQLCGHTIQLPDGSRYAEAHHVQPLGRPHNGPDTIGNILCVCPNHHAELDYGVSSLSLSAIRHFDSHAIEPRYVEYHNRQIHKTGNA
jgi:hypothetical protein